jgi:hypothetical protein
MTISSGTHRTVTAAPGTAKSAASRRSAMSGLLDPECRVAATATVQIDRRSAKRPNH